MEIGIISVAFNFVLVIAFILDRIFRLKSIKEYREARDAEVAVLKERIDFIEKYNDGFVSEKYKKRIDDLKILIDLKEADIEENKKHIDQLKLLHANSEKEKEDFKNASNNFSIQRDKLESANEDLKKEKEAIQKQILKIRYYLSHEIRRPIVNAQALLELYKMDAMDANEFINLISPIIPEIESIILKNIISLGPINDDK